MLVGTSSGTVVTSDASTLFELSSPRLRYVVESFLTIERPLLFLTRTPHPFHILSLQSKGETLRNNFIAGSIGGFVGTALNTPADVYKSRAQALPAGDRIGWTVVECAKIAKNEGAGALYRGFVRILSHSHLLASHSLSDEQPTLKS